jgi:hypothetical protein
LRQSSASSIRLDGIVDGTGAVFEAKFMLPWSFSEEAAAKKHTARLQHNMWGHSGQTVESRSRELQYLCPALRPIHPGGATSMRRTSGPPPKAGDDHPWGPNGQKPNGHALSAGLPAPAGTRRKMPLARPAKPILAADQSAALRDCLVAQLDGLQSADEAASWAHRSLPAKNTLTAADAEIVEAGSRGKARGIRRWAAR